MAKSLYHLPFSATDLYGVTMGAALSLLAAGRYDELYSRILERYKALENRSDFILCVGTDYTGVSTALEFDFNVEVARNLGSALVPVINGRGKDPDALVRSTRTLQESLEARKCDVLTVIINRAESHARERTLAGLKQGLPGSRVYVLPEDPLLERPTVHDISNGLGAELISGDAAWLEGDVRNVKVAAMELPHFLDHLEEGSLVITPGDRSDIILGTFAADRSTSYPRVAGMVLTGNLKPAPQVRRLVEGLHASPVPVLAVGTDTFTTAMNVSSIRPALTIENKRKISASLGIMESNVDVHGLLESAAVTRSGRITPLMFQYELIRRAKQRRRHIVLPEGAEERILRAAEIVLLRDVCDITLLGNPEEIRHKSSGLGLSLDCARTVDPRTSELLPSFAESYYGLRKHKGISGQMAHDTMVDSSYFGTMMVYQGLADGMVSGSIHTTAHTIRPALEFVKTKPGISIVSSVFFMCLADRVKDLKIEGPIQYDAAVDAAVAKVKLPESEVAGRATVFIFPDLSSGNNAYKAVQRSANAIAIGPVLQGLKKPVNDLSRGAPVTDIVNTIAITAIQAQGVGAASQQIPNRYHEAA